MNGKHLIRLAVPEDCGGLLQIYAPYVAGTTISFETEVPSPGEFAARIASISERYPYLVYTVGGVPVGYAYASKHLVRAAYRFDADVSIYVSPGYQGTGVARKLYGRLLLLLARLGYKNLYANCSEGNDRSVRFHERFGFHVIGTQHKTGFKLGKWLDVISLEKKIGDYEENPRDTLSIGELDAEEIAGVLRLEA